MSRSQMFSETIRRAIASSSGASLLAALAMLVVASPRQASADAIAVAPSKVTANVQAGPMLVSGPGGVGATSRVGPANNLTQDPAAGAGNKFDDTIQIGPVGKKVDVLTTAQTSYIGTQFLKVYPMPGTKPVLAGEALRYNSMTSDDKVADANAAANKTSTMQKTSGPITGPAKVTTTSATAIQTTFLNADGTGRVIGLADTRAMHTDPKKAEQFLSVAAINDPLHFNFTSNSQFATASIGGSFMLQATGPSDFASTYFEIGTDKFTPGTDQTLAAFSIGIDSTTTSLAGVDFQFSTFNPLVGFADQGSFESYIESFLTFTASTNTLSVTDPSNDILLYTLSVSQPTSDVEFTFNSSALVGGVVPEPASVVMLGLGLVIVAFACKRAQGSGLRTEA